MRSTDVAALLRQPMSWGVCLRRSATPCKSWKRSWTWCCFDRSGHRTKFTNVGRMLLDRGRVLLEAADKLTVDAEALARGWETQI
jgi:hypothetical protein